MKKLLKLAMISVMVLGVAGCSSDDDTVKTECPLNLGLVTDLGGIDDKSFNEGTWNGVVSYMEEYNGDLDECAGFLQSNAEKDYIPNLSQFADEQVDLVLAPGFLFEKAMSAVAESYPDQKFLIIDTVVDQPNVASAVFAEEQGAYLVGIAAGLQAKEAGQNKFGFIGGMDGELIQRFEAGFEAGVKQIIPDAEFDIQYAADFGAPEKGKTIAQRMYDNGTYIIFHAAGATGNGLIDEAKARREAGKDVWAIGVDSDQYDEGKYGSEGKSAILTSMIKRVDIAAHNTAETVKDGAFKGGEVTKYDVTNDGVGAEVTEGRNLSPEIIEEVNVYFEKIKNGEVEIPTTPERVK